MKRAPDQVGHRLNDFQGMIYAACRLGAWCFGLEKNLYFTTSPHQEEYHMFLQSGGCLDLAYQYMDKEGQPHILGGQLGLAWIAEWVNLTDGGSYLVVLGPVYMKNRSSEQSILRLDQMGISQHLRRQYLSVLDDVPVMDWNMLRQYACMLHHVIYQENIDQARLMPEAPEQAREELRTKESELPPKANDFARMVAMEKRMLDALGKKQPPIGEGEPYHGELQDFHLTDLLRQVKDNLIIFTALCARNAIASGAPLYLAKSMESDWICRIEALRSTSEAAKLLQSMYGAFSKLLQSQNENAGLSQAVRECRDYIRMNYTKPLQLDEIARQVGYTEYYLTRKFAKETGMKLSDYIRSVRIDAAKALLITSKRDIQDISEELQFGSRSYFDRVFRQEVGIPPATFRESMGRTKETT